MKLGIRAKLIGILVVAAVLPLVLAIAAIQGFGYRHSVREKGLLFEAAADHVAQSLSLIGDQQVGALNDLVQFSDLPALVEKHNSALPDLTESDLKARADRIETSWNAPEGSAEVASILGNELSARLKVFQKVHPVLAEVFVTDRLGQLIGSTGKTSDYWQADERWWQRAANLETGQAWLEGLHYDGSAEVFSLDIAVPVPSRASTNSENAGVIKAVLNASPLFSPMQLILAEEGVTREVIRQDGRVLLRLFDPKFDPLSNERISEKAARRLNPDHAAWFRADLGRGVQEMVGYAPLKLAGAYTNATTLAGAAPMFVVVRSPTSTVLSPLRKQVILLALGGGVLAGAFAVAGFLMAHYKIIEPLRIVGGAARTIAATARLGRGTGERRSNGNGSGGGVSTAEAQAQIAKVAGLKTNDELELLAHDFSTMADRVLRYHEQLEEEIAAKTGEIQRDLAMAREFQEALLPRAYPIVPVEPSSDVLSLRFHHLYKPALTVGGDFFDVVKLSEHRAGVFIADVMGHGARSALVTAILRTFLQNFQQHSQDPAALLGAINSHFHTIISQANQMVYVTAVYMVADTREAVLTYASAGHPAPLIANRRAGTVEPLFEKLKGNPVLGLFAESNYSVFRRSLRADDLVVLLTDGIFEATNEAGEEFGRERLATVIRKNLDRDASAITEATVQAVREFSGTTNFSDDICLVVVETAAHEPAVAAPVMPVMQVAAE